MGRFRFTTRKGNLHRGELKHDDDGTAAAAAATTTFTSDQRRETSKTKKKTKKKKKFGIFVSSKSSNSSSTNRHGNQRSESESNANHATSSSSPGNTTSSSSKSVVVDVDVDVDVNGPIDVDGDGDGDAWKAVDASADRHAERGVIDVGHPDDDDDDDDDEEPDLGDIPKSISTPTHHDDHDHDHDHGNVFRTNHEFQTTFGDDFESLDSPLSALRKSRSRRSDDAAKYVSNASRPPPSFPLLVDPDNDIATALDRPPSLDLLPFYIAALSPAISPDPSADVPSRALRALFSLSEHASCTRERIAMVRYGHGNPGGDADGDGNAKATPLVPTLLTFLRRCRKDSSEQYLALLVFNNVSIPPENKRLIALTYGGLKTLGRLLCEDPGCHLLVIILVNLTFSDVAVRKDFLTGVGGVGGGDGMLVDSLAYALLVSALYGIAKGMALWQNTLLQCIVLHCNSWHGKMHYCNVLYCIAIHGMALPNVLLLYWLLLLWLWLLSWTQLECVFLHPQTQTNEQTPNTDKRKPSAQPPPNFHVAHTHTHTHTRATKHTHNKTQHAIEQLASLTTEQLTRLGSIPLASADGTPHTPRKLLSLLRSSVLLPRLDDHPPRPRLLDESPFFETARWCLCALKNLTRPGKLSPSYHRHRGDDGKKEVAGGDAIAAQAIWDAGVVAVLLRVIRVSKTAFGRNRPGGGYHDDDDDDHDQKDTEDRDADRYGPNVETDVNGTIRGETDEGNFPSWSSNSCQDAALYTLLHMTSVPDMRKVLREECPCVTELVHIVECGKKRKEELLALATGKLGGMSEKEVTDLGNLSLQCVKSRMALSYLIGSEGHFGQPRSTDAFSSLSDDSDTETYYSKYHSANLLCEYEAHSIIELLSHSLANRAKEGAGGGYSAATFTVKGVLYSIRCLMINPKNKVVFANIDGARLNVLLLKALGRYSLVNDRTEDGVGAIMDAEAAEHAVFSLYLMSNYGFQESVCFTSYGKNKFLPENFEGENARVLTSKILSSYLDKDGNTPAGSHAALQILLRMKYLNFSGPIDELLYSGKDFPSANDFTFEQKLLSAAKGSYVVNKNLEGAKPKGDVFDRAIIRLRIPADCSPKGVDPKTYSSPLIAVEELSFGSKTVEHSQSIDDIAIANNIAGCAEGFAKQAYGFYWKWEDWGGDDLVDQPILPPTTKAKSGNSHGSNNNSPGKDRATSVLSPRRKGLLGMLTQSNNVDEDEPFTIFGFKCGAPMCGR